MRLLIALAALVSGACYSPSIDDCQFTCGPERTCPDGTACVDSFCRTAAGACLDADPCTSAPAPPTDCTQRFEAEGSCGVMCGGTNERTWNQAVTACGPDWQLAVLDTTAKLDAVPVGGTSHWVGAHRPESSWEWLSTASVAADAWRNGSPPGGGEDCASIGSGQRLDNNLNCGDTQRYVCTWPPR